MSSLIIEVCRVDAVSPHPNADRMAVARIKGWEVCVAKNEAGEPWVKVGDKVVYVPPESLVPEETALKHGVAKYLAPLPKRLDGSRPPGGRVRVASLRGYQSYGYLAPPDDPDWEVGRDVAAHYGITKYEPPVRATQEDAHRESPEFPMYYDMENLRNFPDTFQPGQMVYVTEKIHGENCRLGLIREVNDAGVRVWRWAAGSHGCRRKQYTQRLNDDGTVRSRTESVYWQCFSPEIREMLCVLSGCGYSPRQIDDEPPVLHADDGEGRGLPVVLYGERFGCGVQDMWYGRKHDEVEFRAFDVTRGGKYLSPPAKGELFASFGIPRVPVLYHGHYSFEKMEELVAGPSVVHTATSPVKDNFREGVVISAQVEQVARTLAGDQARSVVKLISFDYLNRKHGSEFK